jgi:hypothetical protein
MRFFSSQIEKDVVRAVLRVVIDKNNLPIPFVEERFQALDDQGNVIPLVERGNDDRYGRGL